MIELLSNAEMAEADRITIDSGTLGIALMENAGRAVAEGVARHSPGSRIVVVAGPGNNGGDGFVAARILAERGYPVRVLLVGEQTKLKGDAAEAARRWKGPVEPAAPHALAGAQIIVDALFGAGLDRPVEGLPRALIAAINAAKVPIIAVDLASGINGTTGAVMGTAVQASESVTFFRRKIGHALLPGRFHCGQVHVADIGIDARVLDRIKPKTSANGPSLWGHAFPVPRPAGHKYTRGHAVVMSGGQSFTGAARLAARGALRAGAGLVTIASPPDALALNATASPAIMVRAVAGPAALAALLSDRRLNAIVLGPGNGVGESTRDMTLTALSGECAVVIDADALTSFTDEPAPLMHAIAVRRASATVLTPHDGEFARLFKSRSDIVEKTSKLEKARAAAQSAGAVVLLKGADTVVAHPDGRAAINENAPPWLATAGSGDVLAGFVTGLLAQGMPAFEAACAAAWLHGEAANEFGPGLIAEDLPEALPLVYRRLFSELAAK
jgi:hydroxyethylthiazole kinase-like uncharacterized protein yjeF